MLAAARRLHLSRVTKKNKCAQLLRSHFFLRFCKRDLIHLCLEIQQLFSVAKLLLTRYSVCFLDARGKKKEKKGHITSEHVNPPERDLGQGISITRNKGAGAVRAPTAIRNPTFERGCRDIISATIMRQAAGLGWRRLHVWIGIRFSDRNRILAVIYGRDNIHRTRGRRGEIFGQRFLGFHLRS